MNQLLISLKALSGASIKASQLSRRAIQNQSRCFNHNSLQSRKRKLTICWWAHFAFAKANPLRGPVFGIGSEKSLECASGLQWLAFEVIFCLMFPSSWCDVVGKDGKPRPGMPSMKSLMMILATLDLVKAQKTGQLELSRSIMVQNGPFCSPKPKMGVDIPCQNASLRPFLGPRPTPLCSGVSSISIKMASNQSWLDTQARACLSSWLNFSLSSRPTSWNEKRT